MLKNSVFSRGILESLGYGFLRVFDDDIDPIELLWHRDKEDRTVEVLHDTDWKFQEDNYFYPLFILGFFILLIY